MKKGLVSIIIPSRNEIFLQRTLDELLNNARGEIEIIVVLDGYWPKIMVNDDMRLIVMHHGSIHKNYGMRESINRGVALSNGEYIMKIDEHCRIDEGYDIKLKEDCEDDWVVTPRRKKMDSATWEINEGRIPVDNMYLTPPVLMGHGLNGVQWNHWTHRRRGFLIDDCMTMQGSCYFMKRKHWDKIGGLDLKYGPFHFEPQEICLKTWLGGGRVVTNKKTWYVHRHRTLGEGRGYQFNGQQVLELGRDKGRINDIFTDYWVNNRWEGRVHDFEWLIEKFWPVPNWSEDWKKLLIDNNIIKNE